VPNYSTFVCVSQFTATPSSQPCHHHFRVAGDDFARVRRELFHRVVLRVFMLGFDLIEVIVVIAGPWS
jgi:hypothetical protein